MFGRRPNFTLQICSLEVRCGMGKLRLLKLCRLRKERVPFLVSKDSGIVVPCDNAIWETSGMETVMGEQYYRMRLVGAFRENQKIGSEAFLPVAMFDEICEWIEIKVFQGKS